MGFQTVRIMSIRLACLKGIRMCTAVGLLWLLTPLEVVLALEVDCAACDYCRDQPDLLVELTARVQAHIKAGHKVAQIALEEGGNALISSPIQDWASRHKGAVKPDPARLKYRGSILPNRALFSAHVSSVKVNGVCLGADKLGHLFQQGWEYYRISVIDGKGDSVAARYGEWLEGVGPREIYAVEEAYFLRQPSGKRVGYGGFGRSLSGVISHADLAANIAGLKFYKDLAAGRFKDMAAYITKDLCEEVNRNEYTTAMQRIVQGNGRF